MPGSKSWRGYESCSDLPLRVFIRCATAGDLSGLVLEGTPDPTQLVALWKTIHAEYCDLAGNGQLNADMNTVRQAQALAVKVKRVSLTIQILREMWIPGGVDQLRIDYPMCELNVEMANQYGKDLDRIEGLIKTDTIKLKSLHAEISTKGQKKPATEEYFEDVLLEMGKLQGYAIGDDITVLKYCRLLHRLNRHIESISRQIQKTTKRHG